jgi:hypothetical protein
MNNIHSLGGDAGATPTRPGDLSSWNGKVRLPKRQELPAGVRGVQKA